MESFRITTHTNGDRTIRATSEIYDSEILRDVIYTVDASFRPRDASIRLTIADEFTGSSWFVFSERSAECEAILADGGRISQRLELDRLPPSFNPHPVQVDMWHFGNYDHSGPSTQVLEGLLTASPLPDGGSGPLLFKMDLPIEYVGAEAITVDAGTFDVSHFRFLHANEWPPQDAWCYGDDFILVKMAWELTGSTYELVEFHQDADLATLDE